MVADVLSFPLVLCARACRVTGNVPSTEERQGLLNHEEEASNVDVEQPVEVLFRHRLGRNKQCDRGEGERDD